MSARQSTKIELACEVCKKSFFVKPYVAKNKNPRFCSFECRWKNNRSQVVDVNCQHCGKEFSTQEWRIGQNRGKFCSRECIKRSSIPIKERFGNFVGLKTPSGCMEWQGYIHKNGYGAICSGKRSHSIYAHRAAWEIVNGKIPDGLHVLHKCDNRRCVNVDHLFLGTHDDNMADCVAKGRHSRGESHYAVKLSTEQVRLIRERYAIGGISQYALAREFGVTQTTIGHIVLGRTRKDG